jgi:hypothetical protein
MIAIQCDFRVIGGTKGSARFQNGSGVGNCSEMGEFLTFGVDRRVAELDQKISAAAK